MSVGPVSSPNPPPRPKEPAANPTNAAFSRLFALATWTARRAEGFTFDDAACALRAAKVTAYDAGIADQAVDRMWSRDKQLLAALGLELRLDGADRYRRAEPRRPRLTHQDAASLAARVRELPADGDAALETGLRKLALLGAPIVGALVDRASRGGPAPLPRPTEHALSVALLLLAALRTAGDNGLPIAEAVGVSGARDAKHLLQVVGWLQGVDLPFERPDEWLPIDLDRDELFLYRWTPAVVAPSLTGAEEAALTRAGLLPAPAPERPLLA